MATQLPGRQREAERKVQERTAEDTSRTPHRLSIGVPGLDEVLSGGLLPDRAYLLRGGPGSGKTTLGLHFLTAGAAAGEPVLFITLAEPEAQIRQTALGQGFDLTGVSFLDLSPGSAYFAESRAYDIFSPSEVEREPTTQRIVETVKSLEPRRVFLDAITQLRYLSPDAFEFRKQALSFLRFLVEKGATALFTSEASDAAPDDDLQFMADGVLNLAATQEGRQIQVEKFRGSGFRSGRHSLRLSQHGMEVFPRLLPPLRTARAEFGMMPSGVPYLDEMLHGGLERSTITIVSGPSGVGKTTLGLQFMKEAAGRGERSVVYLFEEAPEVLIERCENLNIPARAMVERGTLALVPVEPLRFSPDEFASLVRRDVEERGTRIVMIDSVGGYRLSLQGAELIVALHALGKYLGSHQVSLLLINEIENVTGDFRPTDAGISYLADNILFLRYLEINGELRKAIGVLKKRLGDFEKALRQIEISRYGLKVGPPLTGLRGLLKGTPEWVDIPDAAGSNGKNTRWDPLAR